MLKKVTHVTIFVADQDKALDFYKNQLGLEVHTDAMCGEDMRWLTMCPKDQKDFEISLMLNPDFTPFPVPVLCFETDNCLETYKNLQAKGVEFFGEPTDEPWGISATFKDPFGNIFYVNQPK